MSLIRSNSQKVTKINKKESRNKKLNCSELQIYGALLDFTGLLWVIYGLFMADDFSVNWRQSALIKIFFFGFTFHFESVVWMKSI